MWNIQVVSITRIISQGFEKSGIEISRTARNFRGLSHALNQSRATAMSNVDQSVTDLRLYAPRALSSAYTIRDFLLRSDIPFEYVELKSDEQARREAGVENLHDPKLPVGIFADGTRIENVTIRRITEKLGWFNDPSRSEYDLAIYGAGPAGLSSAVYGASEGLKRKSLSASRWEGRRARAHALKTTWVFRRALMVPNWPNERANKPAASERRFSSDERASAPSLSLANELVTLQTAQRLWLVQQSALPAWTTGDLVCRTKKIC
jgi:hypothetical protein